MFFFYSFFSTLAAIFLSPLLALFSLRPKYRKRLPARLGFGLRAALRPVAADKGAGAPRFWVHALSVGEVTSALPLIRGLRAHFPEGRIILSVTTATGHKVAGQLLAPFTDAIIPAPLDLAPVVRFFRRAVRPDLFILVESDFWPNWLHSLARAGIPLALVNGRISQASFARYQKGAFFFGPLFRLFTLLSMQTAADAKRMQGFGPPARRIRNLGNLKFDTSRYRRQDEALSPAVMRTTYGLAPDAPLWICGSTHPGEEKNLFSVFIRLRAAVPALQMLLAPRDIGRTEEIIRLAASLGLSCRRRSDPLPLSPEGILLLDTLGELAESYRMADLAFIGGSLVRSGGHNPIEAAAFGVPVLFGPHMEDFSEIAGELCQSGGALQSASAEEVYQNMLALLREPERHEAMGAAARNFVVSHQGVIQRHMAALEEILQSR